MTTATYESKCAACGDDIEHGDTIVLEDGEWIHEDCAEGRAEGQTELDAA